MENEEHYAYRTMFTLHAARAAVSGCFVRGGVFDLGIPFAWQAVDAITWLLAIVMYLITAYWMARGISSRVPSWIARAV